MRELRKTLAAIKEQDELPRRFCFFIDGLDEFSGDHSELCETVLDLCRSPHIKVCVSSRPWNVFEDAFGGNPASRLNVHDLTGNDILRYAESRLYEHPRWADLAQHSPKANKLITEIVDRAHGVFLWVFLVTRELRSGMTNDDSYSDLERRLDTLPVELGPFFKHLLNSIEPFYFQKMGRILTIATAATDPLQSELYAFHELEYEDEDYALKIRPEMGNDTDLMAKPIIASIRRRLNGRTKGLLEVNDRHGSIDFLHRTVRDFLHTQEMADFLRMKSGKGFCAPLSIVRSYTAWFKKVGFPFQWGPHPVKTEQFRELLSYARVCDDHGIACFKRTECLLDNLEACILELDIFPIQFPADFPSQAPMKTISGDRAFRQAIAESCASNYITAKLEGDPDFFAGTLYRGLGGAVGLLDGHCLKTSWTRKRTATIRALCAVERARTQVFGDTLPIAVSAAWVAMVYRHTEVIEGEKYGLLRPQSDGQESAFAKALEAGIYDLFLEQGANPRAHDYESIPDRPNDSEAWARFCRIGLVINMERETETRYFRVLDQLLAPRSPQGSSDTASFVEDSYPFWTFLSRCQGQEYQVERGRWMDNAKFVRIITEKLLARLDYEDLRRLKFSTINPNDKLLPLVEAALARRSPGQDPGSVSQQEDRRCMVM